jgi:hypothetical protein
MVAKRAVQFIGGVAHFFIAVKPAFTFRAFYPKNFIFYRHMNVPYLVYFFLFKTLLIEAISKIRFWLKLKAGPRCDPQADLRLSRI